MECVSHARCISRAFRCCAFGVVVDLGRSGGRTPLPSTWRRVRPAFRILLVGSSSLVHTRGLAAVAVLRIIPILLCIAVFVGFSYVPFQRWLLHRVRIPVRRWLRPGTRATYARYDELVSTLMGRTISQVAPVIAETLPDSGLRARPLVAAATSRWWKAALWAISARALGLSFLVHCTKNLEAIVDFLTLRSAS